MNVNNWAGIEPDHVGISNFVMKDIFVEQLFVLINPVWDSSHVHTMTDFGQIHYLKTSLSNNM